MESTELRDTCEAPAKPTEPTTVVFKSELASSPLLEKELSYHQYNHDELHDIPDDGSNGVDDQQHSTFPRASAPDGGWGWAVLFGAFYIVAFVINITTCFGILFSGRMRDLNISSAEASYVFMLHNVMFNFGVLLTNTMVLKYGFPVNSGLGSTVSFLIVPLYFERRRGLAMAILMTGVAAGGIVCPLLIRFLQDNYGFFWATLIQGAVILNCCVAAALFRPLKVKKKTRSVHDMKMDLVNDENEKYPENISSPKNISPISKLFQGISDFVQPLVLWMKKQYLVLRKRKVLMIGFSISTAAVGYYNFLMLVPFAVESTGHTPQFAAQCVSASNFSNAATRLLVSTAADRPWCHRTFCFGMGVFIATLTSFAFVFVTHSEAWMTCFMVLFGFGIGLYMSLYHMHMIDVLGMELFSSAMGVNAIIVGATFVLSGPLFGGIRKLSTSYEGSLSACSSLLLCSTLLVVLLHTNIRGCKRPRT